MKVAVLGGSTPFAAPFVDEVANVLDRAGTLALLGRDRRALAAMTAYATGRLAPRGWRVEGTTDLDAALDGADVVVHQIRYGDLAGRADDERLAERLGVPADETLGPAGLRAALRTAPPLRAVAARMRTRAPGALVLNLTNPLSVATTLIADAGLPAVGLCELPLVTADAVAAMVDGDGTPVEWHYTGLNHRGFLHGLRHGGRDVLPVVAASLPDRSWLGVTGAEVSELGALPLKYHALFAGHAPHGSGRAAQVARLRAAAIDELERDPATRPPSLAARAMPWWERCVVPVLAAAISGRPVETVVNVAGADRVVREHRGRLTGRSWDLAAPPGPPAAVRPWLERFLEHERAVLAAVDDPSHETILAACAVDPLLPEPAVPDAVRLLTAEL